MFKPIFNAKLKRYARRAQNGFTLIEMLVVITIIGLIMALVGPRVLNYLSDSKVKAAKIQIESFTNALDLYFMDTSRYPSTSQGLTMLMRPSENIAGWNGPYLKGKTVPKDPWGHPYVYRAPGPNEPYQIRSYGADGQEGGTGVSADITN
jgi:general secretion pathway protein G